MKPEEIETPAWPHDPLVQLTTEIEVLIAPHPVMVGFSALFSALNRLALALNDGDQRKVSEKMIGAFRHLANQASDRH
jgi:thiamine phosphate synthase YjbQ (UPF0047 family)